MLFAGCSAAGVLLFCRISQAPTFDRVAWVTSSSACIGMSCLNAFSVLTTLSAAETDCLEGLRSRTARRRVPADALVGFLCVFFSGFRCVTRRRLRRSFSRRRWRHHRLESASCVYKTRRVGVLQCSATRKRRWHKSATMPSVRKLSSFVLNRLFF